MLVLHMTLLKTCHSLLTACCLQIGTKLEFYERIGQKLRREGLDLHRLLALVHHSCCYATMQHLMTSFCNI